MEQNAASSAPNPEFIHKDQSVTCLIFGIVSLCICLLPVLSVAGIIFGNPYRLQERLRDLEGDFEVYPGHEESTTLDFERRFNPYLMHPERL